jgi:hypothetical protein
MIKVEVLERHPVIEGQSVARPLLVRLSTDNAEESLIIRMISNSVFGHAHYWDKDESREGEYPDKDFARPIKFHTKKVEDGREALLEISITNYHPTF